MVGRKYLGIDLFQGKIGKDAYVGPNGQNNPHCILWGRHLSMVGACDVVYANACQHPSRLLP